MSTQSHDKVVDDEAFGAVTSRLSRASVEVHFDAYADVDWDDPDLALDPADPRLELPAYDPLAHTEWYRAQPAEVRSRIGLYRYAACMKTGWHFENLLQRGLLNHALWLPNGTPQFRYLQHEIIEESQHTLMFQEFVNRSGLPVRGMTRVLRRLTELVVVPLSRRFPPLFFLCVIGGEDPVDHLQRLQLKEATTHPLVRQIMQIHVAEEARHLSFARTFLKRHVPELGVFRRHELALAGPVVLGIMARIMLVPPGDLRRECNVPGTVVREAFGRGAGRQLLKDSVYKTRRLWLELGLMTPASKALWRAVGLWDEPVEHAVAAERAG